MSVWVLPCTLRPTRSRGGLGWRSQSWPSPQPLPLRYRNSSSARLCLAVARRACSRPPQTAFLPALPLLPHLLPPRSWLSVAVRSRSSLPCRQALVTCWPTSWKGSWSPTLEKISFYLRVSGQRSVNITFYYNKLLSDNILFLIHWQLRDGWRYQIEWIFGKISYGLWPLPSPSILENFDTIFLWQIWLHICEELWWPDSMKCMPSSKCVLFWFLSDPGPIIVYSCQ